MTYLAHYDSKTKKEQTILEHCTNVAEKASSYAIDIMKPIIYQMGLAHDIGKYALHFQDRVEGKDKTSFDHCTPGAIELSKLLLNDVDKDMTYMLQYGIIGHHLGIPNGGSCSDSEYNIEYTLQSSLKKTKQFINNDDYSAYNCEINLSIPNYSDLWNIIIPNKETILLSDHIDIIEKYAFFTRYAYSCLVDADYIDTEEAMTDIENRNRKISDDYKHDFSSALNAVNNTLNRFKDSADTELKKARGRLQKQVFINANNSKEDISLLNMPTGSGKTICSVKIALEKCIKEGKERIVYVIPYTSIIDQTAKVFKELFGDYIDIIEHHCNYLFKEQDNMSEAELKDRIAYEMTTQNWDAPFIITTNVQFFESLYSNKSSRLRKVHNFANSIIVFDEVHMIPIEYLQPCIRGIGFITKYLNSRAIFLTATMPDYTKLFNDYMKDNTICNLITDDSDFKYFKKCKYENLETISQKTLINKANNFNSSLIIVNKRRIAKEIYDNIIGVKKYHLSTRMTPHDRSITIDNIRDSLERKEKIIVVSTSLVECGVDFDFNAVFRQLSGLDNIIQSAGRCNRDGHLDKGNMFVFKLDNDTNYICNNDKVNAFREILRNCHVKDNFNNISSLESIENYYNTLTNIKNVSIRKQSIYYCSIDSNYNSNKLNKKLLANDKLRYNEIMFESYAKQFKFINNTDISVVINNCETVANLLSTIRNCSNHERKCKLQQLRQYSIQLKHFADNDFNINDVNNTRIMIAEFDKALANGFISQHESGLYVLSNNNYYNSETGLNIPTSELELLLF